jgi:hypothetical protein
MTPLCKIEVTLRRVLRFREARRVGGIDERRTDRKQMLLRADA